MVPMKQEYAYANTVERAVLALSRSRWTAVFKVVTMAIVATGVLNMLYSTFSYFFQD